MDAIIKKLRQIKIRELLRFCVGGGSAVLTDFLSYRLFLHLGMNVDPSKASSFILGAAVGFVINKLWTFESRRFSKTEILKYILLYSCTAAINTLVNRCVLHIFEIEILAFLGATGVSTVLNFLGQKFFVFQGRRKDS